jgi:hypothetical protein
MLTSNLFHFKEISMQPLVTVTAPQSNCVVSAYKLLSRLSLRQLVQAKIQKRSVPDTSNQSTCFDRTVFVQYPTWCGLRRTVILYTEEAALDGCDQDKVFNFAQHVVTTARGLDSAKSFAW